MTLRINDNGTDRNMTADEETAHLANAKIITAEAKTESDAKASNDAKVLSAKNKLKALGLTEAEVTALVG